MFDYHLRGICWRYSGFSQTHKIGNIAIIAIIANFVFLYICSSLHYLHHLMLVNEKLEVSGCKRIIFQSCKLIVQSISNGIAKMNLAIVAFLYCGEFVKNSSSTVRKLVSATKCLSLNSMQ